MPKQNGVSQKWDALGISTEPKEDTTIGTQNWRHNWLYSVVPARLQIETFARLDGSIDNPSIDVYLAGFCINCRKGFTTPIPYGTQYLETQLEVPVYGCVPPPKG